MSNKQLTQSQEEIKAKESQAFAKANELIRQTRENKNNSPVQNFLKKIEPMLIKLHANKVSYVKISQWIVDVYSYSVSPQSVRTYIKNNPIKKQGEYNNDQSNQ